MELICAKEFKKSFSLFETVRFFIAIYDFLPEMKGIVECKLQIG